MALPGLTSPMSSPGNPAAFRSSHRCHRLRRSHRRWLVVWAEAGADLNLGGSFHRSRIRLISSQVSTIAPAWTGRWTKSRRLGVAWEMLGRVQPARLITHRLPLDQAHHAYLLLDQCPQQALQVLLTYEP